MSPYTKADETVQRNHNKKKDHQQKLKYWAKQLQGSQPAKFLYDKPRPAVLSKSREGHEIDISDVLYNDLQKYCAAQQVSPLVVLLAVLRMTHYRLTGTPDANLGTRIEWRTHEDEQLDTVASSNGLECIRIRIDSETSFDDLIHQINSTTEEGLANRDISLETIASEPLIDGRDSSPSPRVQVVLSIMVSAPDNVKTQEEEIMENSELDIEFQLNQEASSFVGSVLFAEELYHPRTISGMIAVFHEVLKQGMREPQASVTSLYLDGGISSMRDMGLLDIQRTPYERELSVTDVFRLQVAKSPTVVAVKDSAGLLTYIELDVLSDRLASWLMKTGFSAETLIGVFAARSSHAIVAFLGILKANLAYLPLDVKAPQSRVETILSAIPGHKLILLGPGIPVPDINLVGVDFVSIEEILNNSVQVSQISTELISAFKAPTATSLAYVMFTSGSTGKPKGVMIEHRGIVRMADFLSSIWKAAPVAQMANIAFDTSTAEIYVPLLSGGTVVCIDDKTVLDIVQLGHVLRKEKIEVAVLTPALLKECLATFPTAIQSLRCLFIAGDRVDAQDSFKALSLIQGGVYNSYGPTENSVLSTCYSISTEDKCINGVSIGRSIHNSGAYVMDEKQRLVPIGVLGELVVTGDGIARGYTDSEQDLDRFVQVVIDGQPVRAYRTGDYVRYRPMDGLLEFFGRLDHQVKIRGHRIELPEVEHTLLAFGFVSDAATVVREVEGHDPDLVSFVSLLDGPDLLAFEEAGKESSKQKQFDIWEEHFSVSAYAGIDNMDASHLGRDFVGWISMYDQSEIPREEMAEWLEDTISTILDGGIPRNVLEVGTGSGMILFNLPESIQSYLGLEISEQAATFTNKAVQSVPWLKEKAQVLVGTVTNIARMTGLNAPDLVVINSTAQYFPTPEYLLRAITELLSLGSVERIFFGDVRSYALYREFQITHAYRNIPEGAATTKEEIWRRMEAIKRIEEELLIDPAFFTELCSRLPDLIDHVEILPKRMKSTNELSAYRYAAVIHSKRQGRGQLPPMLEVDERVLIDFSLQQLDRQSLLRLLERESASSTAIVVVGNIPNSKTIFERFVLESLDSVDKKYYDNEPTANWFESCRSDPAFQTRSHCSLSVVDLHEVAQLANFQVEISWARQYSQNGGFDAIFHRHRAETTKNRVLFRFPTDHQGRSSQSLTNRPIRQQWRQRIEGQLREELKRKLPSYMIPSVIRIMDKMPVNDNGKVDRRALAKISQTIQAHRSLAIVPPKNDIERVLSEEFGSVLGMEVSMTDSFQDLGGHSLQAARLVFHINQRLKCKIFVFDLLKSPSIAELGELISSKGSEKGSTWHSELHVRPRSCLTLVLIHALWGQGSIFSPMLPLLDDNFDVLIIHDPFFGQAQGPKTIREWADLYLNHVEDRVSAERVLAFSGYSLGGLIAYEMASMWQDRHGKNPASLLLLDAATYATISAHEVEKETNYALSLFGESQKQMILDHLVKVNSLAREPAQMTEYHGDCLCVLTPESIKAGVGEWWKSRCPRLKTQTVDCRHHELLDDPTIRLIGQTVNEFCNAIAKRSTDVDKVKDKMDKNKYTQQRHCYL